jgi:hypothetical protein
MSICETARKRRRRKDESLKSSRAVSGKRRVRAQRASVPGLVTSEKTRSVVATRRRAKTMRSDS